MDIDKRDGCLSQFFQIHPQLLQYLPPLDDRLTAHAGKGRLGHLGADHHLVGFGPARSLDCSIVCDFRVPCGLLRAKPHHIDRWHRHKQHATMIGSPCMSTHREPDGQ